MTRIIKVQTAQNQNPAVTDPDDDDDDDSNTKPSGWQKVGKFFSDYMMAFVAMIIALVVYLIVRSIIPNGIAWWAKEIWALVISLLFLWGFSVATKSHHKGIPGAVILFILALFTYFMISGYSKYESNKPDDKKSAELQNVVDIPILGVGTHTFMLKNIGDETGFFQFPEGRAYPYSISSGDYGYDVYFFGDSTPYPGSADGVFPDVEHPVLNVVANKPGQIVRVTVR